ncbi:TetR/AcrR family transcriptional regulator [Phenylobacterium sp.]|uniref:TetR/AcrR family transcriptional regulator n=1 Tax=Phenylobacterium sp. TaxID=1871053 RepID=UPI002CF63105|nr:TetR/AcrR family transcriptional regulator [Phenylobacterium sp.]HLZ73611.1 TetR/AcrR family transcriptional regulator [Phenylobacterium sp.]
MKSTEKSREIPRQERAREKVRLIVEAAAQVLEQRGEGGFNTNAVAERAGVSIGTLYRYFPDKGAILYALAEREIEAHRAQSASLRQKGAPGVAPDRALIRAFLHAFGRRTRARQVAMKAWFARAESEEVSRRFQASEPPFVDAAGRPLSRIEAFVLSRSVLGAMRAAVLEGADFILDREFEDELVRLARAYRALPPISQLRAD